MKIKTEQEIVEIANKDVLSNYEIEESRKSIPSFTAHAMIDSFVEGAKWTQSNLLESASESFSDYRNTKEVKLAYPIPINTQDVFAMIGKEVWQACSLYNAKVIKEKDERIKELENEVLTLKQQRNYAMDDLYNECGKYNEAVKDIEKLSNELIEAFSRIEPEYCCNGFMCACQGMPIKTEHYWERLGEEIKSKYGLDKQERKS